MGLGAQDAVSSAPCTRLGSDQVAQAAVAGSGSLSAATSAPSPGKFRGKSFVCPSSLQGYDHDSDEETSSSEGSASSPEVPELLLALVFPPAEVQRSRPLCGSLPFARKDRGSDSGDEELLQATSTKC